MFPPEFYSTNSQVGYRVVHTADKHPTPICLRYYFEYLMDDLIREIRNLSVPTLAVTIPPEYESNKYRHSGSSNHNGMDEQLYVKTRHDWMAGTNNHIRVEFIMNSGLLAWKDQPEQFDQLFLTFIQNHYLYTEKP